MNTSFHPRHLILAVLGLVGSVSCQQSEMAGTPSPAVTPPTYATMYGQPTPYFAPTVFPTVAPPTQGTFGGPMNGFHIGDSNLDPTSACASKVSLVGVSGKTIQYAFTVFEPNTAITFRIEGLCGVDWPTANTLDLNSAGGVGGFSRHEAVPMREGTVDIFMGTVINQPGNYVLTIRSGLATEMGSYNDYDDFLFSSLTLTSNRRIQLGQVIPTN
jgi:hypothetical protein